MFYKQTIKAKVQIERAETAAEALNVSINFYTNKKRVLQNRLVIRCLQDSFLCLRTYKEFEIISNSVKLKNLPISVVKLDSNFVKGI